MKFGYTPTPTEKIEEYAKTVFITEDTEDGKIIDLSDPCNIDLKNILDKEGKDIVEIILGARGYMFSSGIIFDGKKIFLQNEYGVKPIDLEKTLDFISNDNDLDRKISDIGANKKLLVNYILDFQRFIASDDFINNVFDNILRLGKVSFLGEFFDKHIKEIGKSQFKGGDIFSAIKKINLTGKKIGKPELFEDFKKSFISNIVQIAYKKKIFNDSANNLFNNRSISYLREEASKEGLNVKIGPELSDIYLSSINLTLNTNLDKVVDLIISKKDIGSQKKIEKAVELFSKKKNIDIGYQYFINTYNNFYLKIIDDINKGISSKKNKINSIKKDKEELNKLLEDLDLLKKEKIEIEKDYDLIDSVGEGKHNHNHITRDRNIDNITKKNYSIKKKKDSIENKKKSLEISVISKGDFKRLMDFIKLKNNIGRFLSYKVLKNAA